jgi:hypothetical protein
VADGRGVPFGLTTTCNTFPVCNGATTNELQTDRLPQVRVNLVLRCPVNDGKRRDLSAVSQAGQFLRVKTPVLVLGTDPASSGGPPKECVCRLSAKYRLPRTYRASIRADRNLAARQDYLSKRASLKHSSRSFDNFRMFDAIHCEG